MTRRSQFARIPERIRVAYGDVCGSVETGRSGVCGTNTIRRIRRTRSGPVGDRRCVAYRTAPRDPVIANRIRQPSVETRRLATAYEATVGPVQRVPCWQTCDPSK